MGVNDIEEHEFVDPTSDRTLTVVFGPEPLAPYDGKHGVRHDGCDRLADVSPELDCWYCTDCRAGGRVSGAWFMDMWMTREPDAGSDQEVHEFFDVPYRVDRSDEEIAADFKARREAEVDDGA